MPLFSLQCCSFIIMHLHNQSIVYIALYTTAMKKTKLLYRAKNNIKQINTQKEITAELKMICLFITECRLVTDL